MSAPIRRLAWLAVGALGLALRSSEPVQADEPRAEFVFVNGVEPKTLDPQLMTGQAEGRIADAIFEGLTRRDAKTLRPVPGQAQSWDISPDGRHYTFHLRKDIQWSNGDPVTAGDFVYAWVRLQAPETAAENAYLMQMVRHAEAFHAFGGDPKASPGRLGAADVEAAIAHFGRDEGVFAPDDRTVVVELIAMTPYFLELTSAFWAYPVHKKSVEASPRFAFSAPGRIVTNGPFLLDDWSPNERIRLRRNARYWGAADVGVETIEALPIGDRAKAFELYEAGTVDWLPSAYPANLVDRLKTRPDFYSAPGSALYWYRFNCTKAPFRDPRVRRALALAVDRKSLCEKIVRNGAVPITAFVPPGMPGYASPPSRLAFDPEAARALLAEAGFPAGKEFPRFTILYNTDEGHRRFAEFVAAGWKRDLGLEVATEQVSWQGLLGRAAAGEFDVLRGGWIGDYPDPVDYLDLWRTGDGNNPTGWGDPAYDRLMRLAADPTSFETLPAAEHESSLAGMKERSEAERAIAALGSAKGAGRLTAAAALRMRFLREAESILLGDGLPAVPVYEYASSGLVKPSVEGFYSQVAGDDGKPAPNMEDLHPLREIRIRPAGK